MPTRTKKPKPLAPPAPLSKLALQSEFGTLAPELEEGREALELVRHERFALHYAINGNATEAAKAAGYGAKGAGQTGWDCLNHPKIRARIRYLRMQTARELGITRARIRAGLAAIAFADVADLFITDPTTMELRMLPVELWPDRVRQAIVGMKVKRYEATVDRETGAIIEPAYQILEFKLESRTTALVKLGQDLSMFKKVVEIRDKRADRAERVLDLLEVANARRSVGVPVDAPPPLPHSAGAGETLQ